MRPPVRLKESYTEIFQNNIFKAPISTMTPNKQELATEIINIERRIQSHTVFHVDDSSFISSQPRATHWSIAWSDLMMTMFILFLSMFVYQAANEEFLGKKTPEILGGDTTGALEAMDASEASFPFVPIHPGLPLMTAGTIKKVERVHKNSVSSQAVSAGKNTDSDSSDSKQISQDQIALVLPPGIPAGTPALPKTGKSIRLQPPKEVLEPFAIAPSESGPSVDDSFQEIFVLSKNALEDNNLDKFAAIDIIPDKTMRIILTSDLLFALGKSELSNKAKDSLRKIAGIVRLTPYMINVVGHTDNIPMQSYKFKSNWELSVARASTVARFFIDEIGMEPTQFVVSGYASYRPIRPNTNAENRAKNRRVEIIISKKLPKPATPTIKNLQ